ncbi:Transglycosylase SLT domain-containing protein [Pseudobutyrivibrio sp. OR37]|uniref:lytic transglycosylase domain-containing protein n=1 Tax=Pseudobutyrivibrio sp. OR37 TaxID=1798186 RepID=UPI0008DEAA8E|nr:lytic transglycosylase domain-containing protein [Pseudobutyrivibrio sp. OR37]SFH77910.1 Transglycosylase SLT domain-containing protein [Pseudobutyrivibrio sp. OR37]
MKISVASSDSMITYEEIIESPTKETSTSNTNATSKAFVEALNQKTVADSIKTATSYKDIFIEASQKYGVSYDLLTAIAEQESGFNPNAVSHTGAMGIMQIMPATANELKLTHPFDAYENIMAGAKDISQKLSEYNGDLDKALAAYNAGSNAVDMYGGVPPYGETLSYVENVKAIMQRGANVPYTNYISRNATKAEIEADLKALLKEMPETEEYAALRNTLAEINYL